MEPAVPDKDSAALPPSSSPEPVEPAVPVADAAALPALSSPDHTGPANPGKADCRIHEFQVKVSVGIVYCNPEKHCGLFILQIPKFFHQIKHFTRLNFVEQYGGTLSKRKDKIYFTPFNFAVKIKTPANISRVTGKGMHSQCSQVVF